MRQRPLVLMLDQPAAALDPESERELFDRYPSAARQSATRGAITLLLSHHLSTVGMADFTAVLVEARVIKFASHSALIQKRGHYAGTVQRSGEGLPRGRPRCSHTLSFGYIKLRERFVSGGSN
jgi:ATP-binding cassette subfamily B protein